MIKPMSKYHVRPIDIYDTFMAKEKKLSITTILQIARAKGIILSPNSSRENLAQYISSIPFDYDDIVELYTLIESDKKGEKTTSTRVKKKLDFTTVNSAVDKLNKDRELFKEVYQIISPPNSPVIVLEATYHETDYSRARMLQTTKRKARIEFTSKTDTLVRFPANGKCTQIVNDIILNIETNEGEKFDVEKIELSHISSPERRNSFFLSLLSNADQMVTEDIVSVKMMPLNADGDDDMNETEGGTAITGLIKRIAIEGTAITALNEYKSLINNGFFISNISWKAKDTTTNPNILVELEAGFSNPVDCIDFKYSVKGIYTLEKDSGFFSLHRKQATETDRLKYLTKIENAAKASMDKVNDDKS
jgi:hypothetical protein